MRSCPPPPRPSTRLSGSTARALRSRSPSTTQGSPARRGRGAEVPRQRDLQGFPPLDGGLGRRSPAPGFKFVVRSRMEGHVDTLASVILRARCVLPSEPGAAPWRARLLGWAWPIYVTLRCSRSSWACLHSACGHGLARGASARRRGPGTGPSASGSSPASQQPEPVADYQLLRGRPSLGLAVRGTGRTAPWRRDSPRRCRPAGGCPGVAPFLIRALGDPMIARLLAPCLGTGTGGPGSAPGSGCKRWRCSAATGPDSCFTGGSAEPPGIHRGDGGDPIGPVGEHGGRGA